MNKRLKLLLAICLIAQSTAQRPPSKTQNTEDPAQATECPQPPPPDPKDDPMHTPDAIWDYETCTWWYVLYESRGTTVMKKFW